MRAVDIFSLAVAALIGLVTSILQPWSPQWWAGVATASIIAALAMAHLIRGWWRSNRKEPANLTMTPGDIAFNGAMMAAVITVLAAFWRKRNIAIVAAVLAWAAIGFDFWYGPPRGFIWAITQGHPIAWQMVLERTGFGNLDRLTAVSFIGSINQYISR